MGSRMALPRHALPAWREDAPREVDVAVVGGGFSGLISAVHLSRALPGASIAVFERRPRAAPGPAYGGCDEGHLLNVPAARMGAFPDDPAAFHRWLEGSFPGRFPADGFAPRALFGRYLVDVAAGAFSAAQDRVGLFHDAVVHLDRLPSRIELLLGSGRSCVARAVILAPGLPPARAPWNHVDHGAPRAALVGDPWEPGSFRGLDPQAEVLVLGSGLTAIDVVQGLRRAGHAGLVRMVSRHGRLPLPHAAPGEAPVQRPLEDFAGGPGAVVAVLRAAARDRLAHGLGWQAAVDAIRPHVADIWRSWDEAQRRRFLRVARPLWEVHRHRAPGPVLEDMHAQMDAGRLTLERGEIASLDAGDGGTVRATLRAPDGSERVVRATRLYNCVGPAMRLRETVDPLLGSLFRSGMASTDALGLGLRADGGGRLVHEDGTAEPRVFLVGALRRGEVWESTAVPELRVQAARASAAVAVALAGEAG